MDKKEKTKALELALGQIDKHFGKGAVMKLGDAQDVRVDSISTGSPSLDAGLGMGGIPKGRVTEIFGAESSGKSTLTYHVMASAQRDGGTAAYIDAEHALDPSYAARCGVDTENLLVSQPDTAEQALEICEYLVRSSAVDVVVVDKPHRQSLNLCVPETAGPAQQHSDVAQSLPRAHLRTRSPSPLRSR